MFHKYPNQREIKAIQIISGIILIISLCAVIYNTYTGKVDQDKFIDIRAQLAVGLVTIIPCSITALAWVGLFYSFIIGILDFDAPNPENLPRNWPRRVITFVIVFTVFIIAFTWFQLWYHDMITDAMKAFPHR